MTDLSKAKFRETNFLPRDVEVTRRDDGTIILSCRTPLPLREATLPAYLRRHATQRPDAPWLHQRRPSGGPWRTVSYAEAKSTVDSLAQGLLDLKLPPGAPLAIVAGNSIEHALIALAAMQTQIPVAPISTAYALQGGDFSKLRDVFDIIKPGVVFVQSGKASEQALAALDLGKTPVIVVEDPLPGHIAYDDLAARQPGPEVERAFAAIDPHATAKFMFTSGSTGSPKAVIQTQHNQVIAIESNLVTHGHMEEGTMIRLDWMPWSHVFGATGIGLTLVSGGCLYIDDGRPGMPLFAETLRNLREVSPSMYVSVPVAHAMIVEALEQDEALARTFFTNLEGLGYGGAGLSDDVARRFQLLAVKHTGFKVPITSGYGATETGPGGAFVYWATDRVGLIGLPHAGFELKLVPIDGERYEVRVRSEAVMPGYFGQPELNAKVFDEDNFYRIGDAATFVDPSDPFEGLVFAGRLSEEFKLNTGTFVLAGSLRVTLLEAAAPLLYEVVICGENEPYVAVMAWLNLEAARELVGKPDATREQLDADPIIRDRLVEAFAAHNARNPGSSSRVVRFLLLDEPPSIAKGEVTDKGSINQRAVQRNRASLVEAIFAEQPTGAVVKIPASPKIKQNA